MALKIIGQKGATPQAPVATEHPDVEPAQVEVFGRLRMTKQQIAEYYSLTIHQVRGLFTRADIRQAYERGKAQTVLAVRQKQLQMALGGNVQLLLHAGEQFADQKRGEAPDTEVDDFAPNRFSWESEVQDRIAEARAHYLSEGGETPGQE